MKITTNKHTKEGREFRSWMKHVCLRGDYKCTQNSYEDNERLIPIRFSHLSNTRKYFDEIEWFKNGLKDAFYELKTYKLKLSESEENYHKYMIDSTSYSNPQLEYINYLVIKKQIIKWVDPVERALKRKQHTFTQFCHKSDNHWLIQQCILLRSLIRHLLRGENEKINPDFNYEEISDEIKSHRNQIKMNVFNSLISESFYFKDDIDRCMRSLKKIVENIYNFKGELKQIQTIAYQDSVKDPIKSEF